MRIVVFAPRGGSTSDLPLDPDDRVTVVCWQDASADAVEQVITVPEHPLSRRVLTVLGTSLPGRMLTRILPLDTGSRFWRATSTSAAVADQVRKADLIVAAERDAGFAVWRWRRRGGASGAVRGYPAARVWIRRRRA